MFSISRCSIFAARCTVLMVVVVAAACLVELGDTRSPPYLGPSDRSVRGASQSKLRTDSTMDVFLNELLPFKASFVLKNVMKNCSRALTPYIDNCYKDYELDSRYTLQLKGTAQELQVGCCNLWKYHECVIDAVERLAHYSYQACNEWDAQAAEEVLAASESHPKSRLMCADYHRQSFYCSNFIESNLALTLVLILGLSAILVAALMAGYMFYLSTLRMKIVYIQAKCRGYHNDGVELMEKQENGQYLKM